MCNDGLHLKNKKTKFQCTWDNIILNKGRENLAHDYDDYLKKKKGRMSLASLALLEIHHFYIKF